jgi:hypothetical protein
LKLLSLLQGHRVEDQVGFHQSGARLVQEGYLQEYQAVPFLAADGLDADNPVYESILETAKKMEPDYIFFQYFHFHRIPDPSQLVAGLRKLPSRPVIFSSGGDSFGRWTRPVPSSLRTLSRIGDLTFLSGMGHVADDLVRSEGQNIALMPHGFCPVRFSTTPEKAETSQVDWEIVCVANNYHVKNPFSYIYQHKKDRIREVQALSRRYGKKFALFGRGWEGFAGWRGPLPYEKQGQIFRSSKVVIGGHPGGSMDYYLSDREFIALSSGAPFVEYQSPRIEKLFRPNEHWYLYKDNSEMLRIVDNLLGSFSDEARQKAAKTEAYTRAKHSNYHRLKEMLRIARDYREAPKKDPWRPSGLAFLLPETNWDDEKNYALKGWA